MDATVIQNVLFIIFAIVTGIVYSVWNYITKTTPETFEYKRMLASAIFGLFLGVIAVYTGLNNGQDISEINWQYMGTAFIMYSGMLIYINRGLDWIWEKLFGAKVMALKR